MVQSKEQPKAGPRKKTCVKILKLVLPLVVVLILLLFLLVPVFVSSKKGNSFILGKINNSIDGRVDFAGLSMGWFKGVSIYGFSFEDNLGRVSAQAKQISTKPHYTSVIKGDLSFGETIIDQPRVNINLADRPEPVPVETGLVALVMDIVINEGNFKVTDSNARTVELSHINSSLKLRPPGRQSDFDIKLVVVGSRAEQSQIIANGKIKPKITKSGLSLKGTTGDVTIGVTGLDLESLEPIFELTKTGITAKGLVSADVKGIIKDGDIENLSSFINAKNLDITGPALKGDRLKTNMLDVVVRLTSGRHLINIEKLRLHSDWLVADAGGVVPTTFKSWSDFLTADLGYKLNADFELDVDEVLSQMPHTFAVRETAKVTSGKLSGNITANRGKLTGQVNLADLVGTVDGKRLALSEPVIGKLQISANDDEINFDSLNVSSSFAQIDASGSLGQIKYDGQIDLQKLMSELGQFVDLGKYEIVGLISEQGTLSVGKNKVTGAGSAQVKNLSITSTEGVTAQEPGAEGEFTFTFDRQSNVLAVDSLNVNSGLGRIDIEQAVIPFGENSRTSMQLDITARNIDLAKAKPFAVLFASLPRETQIAGIAESKISVSSKNDVYKITTDSTKIKDLKLIYPGQKPLEEDEVSLAFEAEIGPDGKTIKNLRLESTQIKVEKGQFTQKTESGETMLSGRAELDYDWSAVSTVAGPYLPEGLTLQGKRKDTVSFTSEYPVNDSNQLLPNLTANATLGFERADYMGLDFGPADFDVRVNDGLLKIAPMETTVNRGQFNFAGQVDFRQKPPLLQTTEPLRLMRDVQIDDRTTQLLLKYLNPVFADAVGVGGIANFNCERLAIPLSADDKKSIEVIGTVSMERLSLRASDLLGTILSVFDATVRSSDITIRPTKFELRGGFVRYDNMQMDIGDNPINFGGVIGLDKSLDMNVTLPYTTGGETFKLEGNREGQRITVPLTGTVDKPEFDLSKLLEGQLQKEIEYHLRRGLDELFQ
jgi:hypothetical protein